MNTPTPNGKVHPVADMFPMMSDEELDELAADIEANGQNNSCVLLPDGTLLDGRNREEACRRKGIKPKYVLLDGQDPVAFIISQNINRRHLNQGQRAILVVKATDSFKLNEFGLKQDLASTAQINRARVSQAATILIHAPDLADAIISGSYKFDPAYQQAKSRKEAKARKEADIKKLQEGGQKGQELWAKVQDENDPMTLDAAILQLDQDLAARIAKEKADADALKQEREIKARHLFMILGTLALSQKSPAEMAAEILNYDVETMKTTQLVISKEVWARAIETLKECAKQWERL